MALEKIMALKKIQIGARKNYGTKKNSNWRYKEINLIRNDKNFTTIRRWRPDAIHMYMIYIGVLNLILGAILSLSLTANCKSFFNFLLKNSPEKTEKFLMRSKFFSAQNFRFSSPAHSQFLISHASALCIHSSYY